MSAIKKSTAFPEQKTEIIPHSFPEIYGNEAVPGARQSRGARGGRQGRREKKRKKKKKGRGKNEKMALM